MTLPSDFQKEPVSNNNRREKRYRCVGVKVFFSPSGHDISSDMSDTLFEASLADMSLSGLAFDVSEELQVGDTLMIMVPQGHPPTERLRSTVRWSRKLGENRFRVGVQIAVEHGILTDVADGTVCIPIDTDSPQPVEVILNCPACQQRVTFKFTGRQMMDNTTYIPLYDCDACGTTRTLTSIFKYNRRPRN